MGCFGLQNCLRLGQRVNEGHRGNWMKTGTMLRGAAALTIQMSAAPTWADPVAIDPASPLNGITDLFSATFDGALSPCTGGSPSYCPFFAGEPGPTRQIVVTPAPAEDRTTIFLPMKSMSRLPSPV